MFLVQEGDVESPDACQDDNDNEESKVRPDSSVIARGFLRSIEVRANNISFNWSVPLCIPSFARNENIPADAPMNNTPVVTLRLVSPPVFCPDQL